MNPTVERWLKAAQTYWAALTLNKKILIGVAGVLILITIPAIIISLRHDPYQILFSELQPEDSRAVVKKLAELNVSHQISDDQTTISVPASQVHGARMNLAKEGLPGQDVVGFEKFDGSTLGMSTYVQRIQYVRAVQGELTRSIQRLSAVKRARVHISLPPKKTFLEEEEPPKASVVLDLRNGQALSKAEIAGVAHLVASAVEGLKVTQVTIVDTKGAFLHRPDEATQTGLSSALLEMQRNIEGEYEKRIIEMLTPVVGIGKVRAKVTTEIDPARINTTEESFDPEKATVKNNIKNEEVSQGSKPNPIGIPGSRANLPGAEAQNPPVPVASTSTEKNTSNTSYAIPRKIQVVDKPSGSIKRLTVAVVVDGNYPKNNEGKESFAPRPEEELKRIQELVGNAVGYDLQRRDSITVTSMPFHAADVMPEDENSNIPWWKNEELVRYGVRNLLIGTILLLFLALVLRPFLNWLMISDVEEEEVVLPKTVEQMEAELEAEKVLPLAKAAAILEEAEAPERKEEEDLKNKILEKLGASPKKSARVIIDWIEEDNTPQAAEG